jgi:hypothetical protein
MKQLTYSKKGVTHTPLNYYIMNDDTLIAIYQGFRGENPELDFILKYKEPGKRLRTPSHTHWIVDLLVKSEYNKNKVGCFIDLMLKRYDELGRFSTVEQRNQYELEEPFRIDIEFEDLNGHGYYKMDTLTSFIELFSINEKQTSGAFMFKTLLELVKDYCDGKKDFYQVVGYSKRV